MENGDEVGAASDVDGELLLLVNEDHRHLRGADDRRLNGGRDAGPAQAVNDNGLAQAQDGNGRLPGLLVDLRGRRVRALHGVDGDVDRHLHAGTSGDAGHSATRRSSSTRAISYHAFRRGGILSKPSRSRRIPVPFPSLWWTSVKSANA